MLWVLSGDIIRVYSHVKHLPHAQGPPSVWGIHGVIVIISLFSRNPHASDREFFYQKKKTKILKILPGNQEGTAPDPRPSSHPHSLPFCSSDPRLRKHLHKLYYLELPRWSHLDWKVNSLLLLTSFIFISSRKHSFRNRQLLFLLRSHTMNV